MEVLHNIRMGVVGKGLFAPVRGNSSDSWESQGEFMLTTGSPYLKGIKDNSPVYAKVFLKALNDTKHPGVSFHGKMYPKKPRRDPAGGRSRLLREQILFPVFMKKSFGKGTLFFFGMPLANGLIYGGDDRFNIIAYNIFSELIKDSYPMLYHKLRWNPPAASNLNFRDDFMRKSKDTLDWKVSSGTWKFGGDKPKNKRETFTLICEPADGIATSTFGKKSWKDYLLAASFNCMNGDAGIWLSTNKGKRALFIDRNKGLLKLAKFVEGKLDIIKEVPIPLPLTGWRRISLTIRQQSWQGFIDGKIVISEKTGETISGPCGLLVSDGRVLMDDVLVCDSAALPKDSDRLIGEEGASRSQSLMIYGNEPRMIYSPVWMLKPHPKKTNAVKATLPTYHQASLKIDGKTVGFVPPSETGADIFLPAGQLPKNQIEFVTQDWRDYTFSKQVIDWYSTSGKWERQIRWSCDARWSFHTGIAKDQALMWYRHPLKESYAINLIGAFAMLGKRWEIGRDFNIVLGGNGKDLKQGMVIRQGPIGKSGITFIRDGKFLKQDKTHGIPFDPLNNHNRWYNIKILITPTTMRYYFDGQLVTEIKLDKPLNGSLGIWTKKNVISIARVTISSKEW